MWKKENLRKNFLRVKQMADQNFGRAERSEVLTEDQQGNEKRVEVVRQVSHNLIKKVSALLQTQPGTDAEKRLKKLPETSLGHTLMDSANLLGTDSLLGKICQQCGECQSMLALEELNCELDIEKEVLAHLQTIEEIDIPSIMKHRKHLNKCTLDMDSAKNRFNSAVRQSHVQGANVASTSAKVDAVREEYDEACNKVELVKDNLSIELCNFVAKENEHSSRLVALLESQAAYHKKALHIIEKIIPEIKATIEASEVKPVFGQDLGEHLQIMGRDISVVLEVCIMMLLETGMEEEGLFRIGGAALKLKKLKACFDAHAVDVEEFSMDPHTVACVLKQYLRELPEPLLTFELHSEFMQAIQLPPELRFNALYTAVNNLPPANYKNVRYLIKFLALLAEKSHINKMTPSNIAIVMGPNLLWARGESAPNMLTTGTVSSIVEAFVTHADLFFPGEFGFHLTGHGCAPPCPPISLPVLKQQSATATANNLGNGADVLPEKQESRQGPTEENRVNLATWETREALNTSQDSGSPDEESEWSEGMMIDEAGTGDGPEINFAMMDGHHSDSPVQERRPSSVSVMSMSSPCVMTQSSATGNTSPSANNAGTPNNTQSSATGNTSPSANNAGSPNNNKQSSATGNTSPSANNAGSPNNTQSPATGNTSPSANNAGSVDKSLSRTVTSSESPHHINPIVHRRPSKKPAPPPPPPDRMYSVAVTASVSRESPHSCPASQTWPRNAVLVSPESIPETGILPRKGGNGERHPSHSDRRPSMHDRPSVPPPDRPNIPPADRPKGPPAAQHSAPPGGHHRSASTGTMCLLSEAVPKCDNSSDGNSQAGMGTLFMTGHENVLPGGTNTLGRYSSMRPARPSPPPPPPPVNLETEETHL